EERHGDGAHLRRPEQPCVEGERRLQHQRDAVARPDAPPDQPVGEARGRVRQFPEGQRLVAAVGMSQTHGDSVAMSVPVQALVSYVQALSIAVEQLPRPGRGEMALGVGVGRVIHQGRQFIPASRFHRSFRGTGGVVNAQSILYWYNMEPAPRQRIRAVPAVTRAVAILRLLDRADAPMGVNAIARELDLVPSTCLHILRALTEEELVAVDPATKRYTLEAGIVSLARRALRRDSFSNAV